MTCHRCARPERALRHNGKTADDQKDFGVEVLAVVLDAESIGDNGHQLEDAERVDDPGGEQSVLSSTSSGESRRPAIARSAARAGTRESRLRSFNHSADSISAYSALRSILPLGLSGKSRVPESPVGACTGKPRLQHRSEP